MNRLFRVHFTPDPFAGDRFLVAVVIEGIADQHLIEPEHQAPLPRRQRAFLENLMSSLRATSRPLDILNGSLARAIMADESPIFEGSRPEACQLGRSLFIRWGEE